MSSSDKRTGLSIEHPPVQMGSMTLIPTYLNSNDLLQANLPCAVCHTDTKLSVLTVPAQYTCPNGWSMEYNGYLMTEIESSDRQRQNTLCVDQEAEAVPGSEANTNPAVVYLMRATCDGLPCPPYNTNMALPCAVCSK